MSFKSSHSKRRPNIGFQDRRLSHNAGQSIAECSEAIILQYVRPFLSYHLLLTSVLLFSFWNGR